VAVPTGHELARRRKLRFEETLDEVCIGVTPGGMMDLMLRRQAALLGRTQAHRIQVSSMDAACRIVAAGLGIAILPREASVLHAAAARLNLVPLAEVWAERRFVVCSRADAALPASARLLAEHLAGWATSPAR
jgi:DNA-binding transcriptional LysR family regulator